MQRPDDPTLAAAVDSPTRHPLVSLRADWSRDGTYSHALSDLSDVTRDVTVERSLTGDLPPECTLVEGYATAKLTAGLGGQRPSDPRDIARMLSPFRSDSPLYGLPEVDTPITCDLGFTTDAGPAMLRQFTGSTRSLAVSSADRTVSMESLDQAGRLRVPISLPPDAEMDAMNADPEYWGFRWLVNTQWIVDYVLRRNGIFFSPPPRPNCLWAVTCHGGMAPDIGYSHEYWNGRANNLATDPLYIPGVYGLAANGGPNVVAIVNTYMVAPFTPGLTSDTAHLFEFYIKAGGTNAFHPFADGLVISASTYSRQFNGGTFEIDITTAGQLTLSAYNAATKTLTVNGPKFSGAAAWHAVGCWVKYDAHAGTLTHQWMVDGVVTPPATVPLTSFSLYADGGNGEVWAASTLPVQCMQVSLAPTPPANWGKIPHVSQADVDTGLNWLAGLPDVVNGDGWQVIRDAVAAEYGIVGFDESGRFSFVNRDTARARATAAPVRSLTSAVSLSDLTVSTAVDSVRNVITAEYTPRLQTHDPVKVWESPAVSALDSPPGTTTITITLPFRTQLTRYQLTSLPPTSWPSTSDTDAFISLNRDTGARVSNVTVSRYQTADDKLQLRISNPNSFWVRFARDSATPALVIWGPGFVSGSTTKQTWTNTASVSTYGQRVLSLPNNEYRQQGDSAAAIAGSLLTDLAAPVPVLSDVPVVGDPRLELADIVTLSDPDGLGGPIRAHVIGIRRALSDTDGLSDTLTLRAEPPNRG
ncbi:hypothetical protein [Kutzneria sp. NPDC051319]|uniref:hypothetical protein n=1 Tax=Kutzneria sp. NPDC051319 TaxID=3155047 RepID=UPI003422B2AC